MVAADIGLLLRKSKKFPAKYVVLKSYKIASEIY